MDSLKTLDGAKKLAAQLAAFSKERGSPVAFEVVQTSKKKLEVQPFGMHALFKTHKLLHVEPIPQ